METKQAIIFGFHINAYSIALSLREIGWTGRIVLVREEGDRNALGHYLRDLVDISTFRGSTGVDFLDQLSNLLEQADQNWIFFTSERYHDLFYQHADDSRLRGATVHLGTHGDPDVVLDRMHFYNHLESIGINTYPMTIPSDQDPWAQFGDSFFLRVNRSWKDMRKQPQGAVIRSLVELEHEEGRLRDAGLEASDWCYQELLSIEEEDNVSVCGWHDPVYYYYTVTRKRLQTPPMAGNGDICEQLAAPPGLFETTETILRSLNYHGPFELEFIRDGNSLTWPVIELNPRFWMQHRLVQKNSDHVLIRRYLGEDVIAVNTGRYKQWVRPDRMMNRLLHGDKQGLRGFSPRSLYVPSLQRAAVVLFRSLLSGRRG